MGLGEKIIEFFIKLGLGEAVKWFKNNIRVSKKTKIVLIVIVAIILVVVCVIYIINKNNAKSIQEDAQKSMAARTTIVDTVDEDIEPVANEETADDNGEENANVTDESSDESIKNESNNNDNTEMNTVVTESTPDMLANTEEQYLKFFIEEPSIIKPLSTAEFESVLRERVYNVTQSIGNIDVSLIKNATIEQNNKLCEASKTEEEAGDDIDFSTLLGIAITREKIAEELNHQPAMQLAANSYLKLMDMENNSSDKLEYGYKAYKLFAKSVQIKSDTLDNAPYSLLNIGDIFYNLAQNAKVESKMPLYFKALIYYRLFVNSWGK